MAHFEKYSKAGTWQVLEHDKHTREGKHIDKERTHLNYNLADVADPWQFVKDKIAMSKNAGNRFNSRSVAMVSCVVTLPKDYKGDPVRFFEECKKYLDTIFGAENCISAWVHQDESQPHMHYKFCPIEKDSKKFNAKKLIDRKFLKGFHSKMEKALSSVFGFPVGIENGATTKGNQTIQQLKALSEAVSRLESTQKNLDALLDEYNETVDEYNRLIDDKTALENRINKLNAVSRELEQNIKDMRKTITTLEGEDFAPIFNNKDRISER